MAVRVISSIKSRLRTRRKYNFLKSIYEKYSTFTMIDANVYINNLLVMQECEDIRGCIVECGTWRGGMIAGVADLFGPGRQYFLFDSFEGLPPAKEIDGPSARAWQSDTTGPMYHDNCTAPIEYAERAMARSRATVYSITKGWFDKTLPGFEPPEPIAILRLDADWFDSTIVCLESLVRHMSKGGIVILDDYFTWDGCSRAVHHFLAKTESTARVTTNRGICVLRPRL
jgi:O-methyltransferase